MKAVLAILLVALFASGLLLAQETTTSENTPTETPTLLPSETATELSTQTPTDLPTETLTAFPTSTPSEFPTRETTVEVTEETTANLTEEMTPTLFDIPTLDFATLEPTPTETPLPILLVGVVRYQNRASDLEQIRVTAYNTIGQVIGFAATEIDGRFEIEISYTDLYHLIINAPLHQTLHFISTDMPNPLAVILAGGDLDGDGCVLTEDLTVLTSLYDTDSTMADINADGIVDVADLSILAGNLQDVCTPWTPFAFEPTAEVTLIPEETPTEEVDYLATPGYMETVYAIHSLTPPPYRTATPTSQILPLMDDYEIDATATAQALTAILMQTDMPIIIPTVTETP